MAEAAGGGPRADLPADGLDVVTVAADTLRAGVRVTGAFGPDTAPALATALRAHLTAGRRYLRVDLAAAHVTDVAVVQALVAVHHEVVELGGMLIFENAGPAVVDAIRAATLYARPSD